MLTIFIDADGCPVKDEVYRVAQRYQLQVRVVANRLFEVPGSRRIEAVLVENRPDAADHWIAEHVESDDIVVTADIPLAASCLEKKARVLGPKGREFTTDSIGEALAMRELTSNLRDQGIMTRGPPPFAPKDRSRFLSRLDEIVNAIRRQAPPDG